jgi:LAO/AO transport system kinase
MSSDAHSQPGVRRVLTADEYVAGVRAGDRTVLARALTLVESSRPGDQPVAEAVLAALLPYAGQSIRVGITGVPGAGKSTFIEALGIHLIALGHRVAVLAVDPSSARTGGSILGDKTRMTRLAAADAAYIRPSPSAGTFGGVARKTREAILVCEAAGFDVVLVETVGVGQSETEVADMTDCFLALMLPGAGDELQGIKRGLLERVDVIAVNKADGTMKQVAALAAEQYRHAVHLLAGPSEDPLAVLTCSALSGQGIAEVWSAVEQRHGRRRASGELAARRGQQSLCWLGTLVEDQLRRAFEVHAGVQSLRGELERAILAGAVSVPAAARRLVEAFMDGKG